MTQTSFSLTRRQALAGLGATTALTLGGCAATGRPAGIAQAQTNGAERLLEVVAYNLLEHEPERATALGVDTGRYSELRARLEDQSQTGQDLYAATLRRDLGRVRAVPREGLDPDLVTSLDVVESAYSTALDGFALPYGDVAVGSWRNAPYVVIQNVGTYLDMPRFLDSSHPLEDGSDADAYMERLEALPGVLDGELERMQAARGMGVVPPAFLLDKALEQMQSTIGSAQSGELFVAQLRENLAAKNMPSAFAARAQPLVSGPIAEALTRQIAELGLQRGMADNDAGMWSQPRGDEWYAWALRASKITRAPSADKTRAVAAPMPRAAPVTTAVSPLCSL